MLHGVNYYVTLLRSGGTMRIIFSILFLAGIYSWYYIPELISPLVLPPDEFKNFYNAVCLTDFVKIAAWALIAGLFVPWEKYRLKILFYIAFCFEAHSAISFIIEKYCFGSFLSTNAKIASLVTLVPLSLYIVFRLYKSHIVPFDRDKVLLAVRPPLNHWALIPFMLYGYGHIGVVKSGYMYAMKKVDGGVTPAKYDLNSPLAEENLKKYVFMKTKHDYNFDDLMNKKTTPISKYNCFTFVRDARVKK
jgi:hypothetical protein